MKFPINDFFSKYDQIRRELWIWSHLLEKSFMENFIFCAVISDKSIIQTVKNKFKEWTPFIYIYIYI